MSGRQPSYWSTERIALAVEFLRSSETVSDAHAAFSGHLETHYAHDPIPSLEGFRRALRDHGVDVRKNLVKLAPLPKEPDPEVVAPDVRFEDLVVLARKHQRRGGLTLEAVCDHFDLSPAAGRRLVASATAEGYNVDVLHDELTFTRPQPNREEQAVAGDVPKLGEWATIGVISDLHVASKHHEAAALREHIRYMVKERGAVDIMVPGDLTAGGGNYRFLKYEVTCTGIEDQSKALCEALTEFPGVRYHIIGGNHDESFDVGIDAARYSVRLAEQAGRRDMIYYGCRGAMLRLGGLRWGMWHPGGSLSYALTYKTQRYIDATAPEDRPDILLVGHFHQAIYFQRGGVHAFLCGTFENGDSNFGRMIGGDVALGGWVIRYALDAEGKLASVNPEFRSYPHEKMRYVSAD